MILHARPVTAALFAPFGQLVAACGQTGIPVNEGRGLRLETGAALVHTTSARRPTLALYHLAASPWPVPVRLLERHCQSAQMFLPLKGGSWLIVVAGQLPNGEPDLAAVSAFTAAGGQGIIYAPGVWHHPLVVLGQPAEIAMLMWEDGTAGDCDVHPLAISLSVQPPPEP